MPNLTMEYLNHFVAVNGPDSGRELDAWPRFWESLIQIHCFQYSN